MCSTVNGWIDCLANLRHFSANNIIRQDISYVCKNAYNTKIKLLTGHLYRTSTHTNYIWLSRVGVPLVAFYDRLTVLQILVVHDHTRGGTGGLMSSNSPIRYVHRTT